MEVAANAMKDQKPARVAVLYDLEVRAHWARTSITGFCSLSLAPLCFVVRSRKT